MGRQVGVRGEGNAVGLGVVADGLFVEGDQRRQKGSGVADHHRIHDVVAGLERILQILRGHKAACGQDHVVLGAASVHQVAVVIETAQISGVAPAILKDLGGGLGILEVTQHQARTLAQHLSLRTEAELHPR